MGRLTHFGGAIALAVALTSAPAFAQDTGISCMQGQYTEDQTDQLAALAPGLLNGTELNQPVFEEISALAMGPIASCAAQANWSEQQILFAAFYELGRINESAFRDSGTLAGDEVARIDDALAQGDRANLWSVVERSVRMGMGQDIQITEADTQVMGEFISEVGLDVGSAETDTPEVVGMFLGFMGLQRYGAREFAKLSAKAP